MAATVITLPSTTCILGTSFLTGSPSSLLPSPGAAPKLILKRPSVTAPLVLASAANHVEPRGDLSRRQLFTLTATSAAMTAIADGLGITPVAMAAPTPGPNKDFLNPGKYGTPDEQEALRKLIHKVLDPLINTDPTAKGNAGALVRLSFHDGFTRNRSGGGANASVRLERERGANRTLDKAFDVIDAAAPIINANRAVPVSLADLYQLAGAQAVEKTGGPKILVPIGRSDATDEDPKDLLPGTKLNIDIMRTFFRQKGFSDKDLVALSGAHTVGLSRALVADKPLDPTPATFDNSYFKQLLKGDGLFQSDNALITRTGTRAFVNKFAEDQQAFFDAFTEAYIKLSLVGWKLPA